LFIVDGSLFIVDGSLFIVDGSLFIEGVGWVDRILRT
jgi:hypothetical protein